MKIDLPDQRIELACEKGINAIADRFEQYKSTTERLEGKEHQSEGEEIGRDLFKIQQIKSKLSSGEHLTEQEFELIRNYL